MLEVSQREEVLKRKFILLVVFVFSRQNFTWGASPQYKKDFF